MTSILLCPKGKKKKPRYSGSNTCYCEGCSAFWADRKPPGKPTSRLLKQNVISPFTLPLNGHVPKSHVRLQFTYAQNRDDD